MAIAPMRPDPRWGADIGPHFSVCLAVGLGTADADGVRDP